MSGQALRCAYCGKPLEVSAFGVLAWRAGKDFVCDEFCADGIAPAYIDTLEVRQSPSTKLQAR
jgi:hypothetical protein